MTVGTFPAAAIFGQPVRHSRSPLIHSHWLRKHHLSGAYLVRDVGADDLPDVLNNLSALGLCGANLTMPLKEAACAYVQLDDTARMLNAVNTVWIENGQLYGTNTDGHGFIASLDEQAPQWRGDMSHIAVLGAGGAARAIVHALIKEGAERITLINRSIARAENLQSQFGSRMMRTELGQHNDVLKSASLLINTTSLGMIGQPPLEIDVSKLPQNAIVADIVYVPLETPLLRAARMAGRTTVDGLGMLLHQAAPGFARWFGVMPAVTAELRAELVSASEQER